MLSRSSINKQKGSTNKRSSSSVFMVWHFLWSHIPPERPMKVQQVSQQECRLALSSNISWNLRKTWRPENTCEEGCNDSAWNQDLALEAKLSQMARRFFCLWLQPKQSLHFWESQNVTTKGHKLRHCQGWLIRSPSIRDYFAAKISACHLLRLPDEKETLPSLQHYLAKWQRTSSFNHGQWWSLIRQFLTFGYVFL